MMIDTIDNKMINENVNKRGKRNRSNRHEFYLSDSEESVLSHKLNQVRMFNPKSSFNGFMVELILNSHVIVNDTVNLKLLFDELNRIGVNINQIAKRVNERNGSISNDEISSLKDEYENIHELFIKYLLR